jgi:hypothetical protein
MPAVGAAPGRNEIGEQQLQALERRRTLLRLGSEAVDTLGENIGHSGEVALHRRALLPVLIDHLDEGAKADGDQERDDQGGHRAAKRRLSYQQSMVGRFRDRLRQSLDRIGLDARARRVCARHALHPQIKIKMNTSGSTPLASESQRFESSFAGLSRVNDSLISNKSCPTENWGADDVTKRVRNGNARSFAVVKPPPTSS